MRLLSTPSLRAKRGNLSVSALTTGLPRRLRLLAMTVLGALLVLSFAPFKLYFLAWLIPGLVYHLQSSLKPKQTFFTGFVFGFGLFMAGASWIFISIHRFGNSGVLLAGGLTLLFVAILALFYGLQFLLSSYIPWKKTGFALSWILFEYLRANLFSGFPWLILGYSQTNSVLKSFAPLLGVYGISLLVILVNLSWHELMWEQRKRLSIAFLSVLCLSSIILYNKNWTTPTGKTLNVSLIQANIPQRLKWDPNYVRMILQRYQHMSEQQHTHRLLVWPEGAIPIPEQYAGDFLTPMRHWAQTQHLSIIAGNMVLKHQQYYNAMLLFGRDQGHYYKRHLVPFGEFIPFKSLISPIMRHFAIPMSDLAPGPTQQALLHVGNFSLSPLICYEIAYPGLVWRSLQHANAIIYISDDSWFGDSIASSQQLQFAQMRALETGRYVISATNNGITAVISPTGDIVQQLPRNQQASLTALIPAMQGNTPLLKAITRWHTL